MPLFRHKTALGRPDDLRVIEDQDAIEIDAQGHRWASFRLVDPHTVYAHPLIMAVLLAEAEPMWTKDELFKTTGPKPPASSQD